MSNCKYKLFSQDQDKYILEYIIADTNHFKKVIIEHLTNNPKDVIEYHIGDEIRDFFEINPKNGNPSKCVLVGANTYYKTLELPS